MQIIDACVFFNEIHTLKLRLGLLYEKVDVFVICESNVTFTGKHKKYNFIEHKNEFSPYMDKIIFIQYEPDISSLNFSEKDTEYTPTSAPWIVEQGQRNFLSSVLTTYNPEDIAIVCDVDEIWSPNLSDFIRSGQISHELARLEMQFYYYYLNCIGVGQNNSIWTHPFFSKISQIMLNPDVNQIRIKASLPVIENAGWHFSSLGGAKKISEKISAFSHQEINTPEINNPTHLERCIKLGIDLLNRPGYEWTFRAIDDYPEPLRGQIRKFPHLIKLNEI
jgi:beta-1,4-mannosyl-glycoprotein beta-1,4-N-acetylglucosaminyltransferase